MPTDATRPRRLMLAGLVLCCAILATFAVIVLPGTTNAAGVHRLVPIPADEQEPVPINGLDGALGGPLGGPAPTEVSEAAAAFNQIDLPSYFDYGQVVAFYGYPGFPVMGRLGAHADPADAAAAAAVVAAEHDAVNGDRDVIAALHLIVSVAQPTPMSDGSYLARLDRETIESYVAATREAGVLLFLDLQIGWADPLRETQRYHWALREPHVHLALDPEFATASTGGIPGQVIGTLSADAVNEVQAYLAEVARTRLLPRKILVLHQFMDHMLAEPERYDDVPEVEISVDMDGFGGPWPKLSKYDRYSLADYSERPAIKLFYEWDEPLITPAELEALEQPPDLIIYQ